MNLPDLIFIVALLILLLILIVTSITLGLLFPISIRRRRDDTQREATNFASGPGAQPACKQQLDKIEKSITEGTGFAIFALAIAFILFSLSELQIPLLHLFLFFWLGILAIIYAVRILKIKIITPLIIIILVTGAWWVFHPQNLPQPQSSTSPTGPPTSNDWIIALVSVAVGSVLGVALTLQLPRLTKPQIQLSSPKMLRISTKRFWTVSVKNQSGFLRLFPRDPSYVSDPVAVVENKYTTLKWMDKTVLPETAPNQGIALGEGQAETLFVANKVTTQKEFGLGLGADSPVFGEGVFALDIYLNRYLYGPFLFVLKNTGDDFILKGPITRKKRDKYLKNPQLFGRDRSCEETIEIAQGHEINCHDK